MKSPVQLATLAFVFGAAVACSDMTSLNPELTANGGGKGGGSTGSSRAGRAGSSNSSGSKSAASGGSGGGKTASGGQRTAAAGGRATSTGGSGGSSSAGSAGVPVNVVPSGSAMGAGGAGGADAVGAAGKANTAAGAVAGEAGSAGAGGSREVPRTSPPFFSEYIEGSGNNKALELATVELGRLDGCVIRIYANGALSASRSIALSGLIEPNIPVVICSPQLAELTGFSCDFTESLPFNGNDAIVLSCAGEVVDSIGQLGSDPGEQGWGSGALRTQDRTLRRLCTVTEGDREPSDTFQLAADGWVASGSDVFDGLGVRCEPVVDGSDGAGGDGGAGGSTHAGGSSGSGGAEAGGS